jgi:sugar phosphate isomerase/epimerase
VKLAASSIAWDPADDPAVASLLHRHGVAGIELAPTKWRARPYEAHASDVAALRRYWNDLGFEIVALQSLLFGRPELRLFGSDADRAALADVLRSAIDFAATLGAHALVFGSPKSRARGELPMSEALRVAAEFFQPIAVHARERGCALCIEPNPPAYGCDFITTTREARELCRLVDDPGLAVNVDAGALAMNGEDPIAELTAIGTLAHHAHASAPHLTELADREPHANTAAALRVIGYDRYVSLEMRQPSAIAALEQSVSFVRSLYG